LAYLDNEPRQSTQQNTIGDLLLTAIYTPLVESGFPSFWFLSKTPLHHFGRATNGR
jgi:hypothetical protein